MILGSGFWPLFWALIAGGAALTAVVTLLTAGIPACRTLRRPAARPARPARYGPAPAPRYGDEPAPHQRAA